jgi:hypothetical protein
LDAWRRVAQTAAPSGIQINACGSGTSRSLSSPSDPWSSRGRMPLDESSTAKVDRSGTLLRHHFFRCLAAWLSILLRAENAYSFWLAANARAAFGDAYSYLMSSTMLIEVTSQSSEGGDLREAVVDVPLSVSHSCV